MVTAPPTKQEVQSSGHRKLTKSRLSPAIEKENVVLKTEWSPGRAEGEGGRGTPPHFLPDVL